MIFIGLLSSECWDTVYDIQEAFLISHDLSETAMLPQGLFAFRRSLGATSNHFRTTRHLAGMILAPRYGYNLLVAPALLLSCSYRMLRLLASLSGLVTERSIFPKNYRRLFPLIGASRGECFHHLSWSKSVSVGRVRLLSAPSTLPATTRMRTRTATGRRAVSWRCLRSQL